MLYLRKLLMLAEEKKYETCPSQKEALARRRTSETCKTFQEINPRLGTILNSLDGVVKS